MKKQLMSIRENVSPGFIKLYNELNIKLNDLNITIKISWQIKHMNIPAEL